MMKLLPQILQYQETFSIWAESEVSLNDDFDLFCESDFDFIEILMLFEKEFSLNLFDTSKSHQDFYKVLDFFSWVITQPEMEQPFTFLFSGKFKVLPIPEFVDKERELEFQT